MSPNAKIAVIGGDLRQIALARLFAENGIETAVYGFDLSKETYAPFTKCPSVADALCGASAVVLPLPYTYDNKTLNAPLHEGKIYLDGLFTLFKPEQLVCGGLLKTDRPNTFDYYAREELQILNAIPTAEGAIAIALDEMPITLHGSKALIIGYGRIGKALAERLKGLGCKVTVAARKESDLALCESSNYSTVRTGNIIEAVNDVDVIFNTAPVLILNEDVLKIIDKKTLIIDLAGKPGGVDFEAADRMGLKTIWALSLPGKVAPVTAGAYIYKTLINIFRQEGVI